MLKKLELTYNSLYEILRINSSLLLASKIGCNSLSLPFTVLYPNEPEISKTPPCNSVVTLLSNCSDNTKTKEYDNENLLQRITNSNENKEKIYEKYSKLSSEPLKFSQNQSYSKTKTYRYVKSPTKTSNDTIGNSTIKTNKTINTNRKNGNKCSYLETGNSFDKSIDKKEMPLLTEKELLKSIIIKKLAHNNLNTTNRDGSTTNAFKKTKKRKNEEDEEQIDISNLSNDLLERNLTRNFTPDYHKTRKKRMERAKQLKNKTKVPQVEFKVDFEAIRRRNDEIKIKKSFMK